MAKLVDRMQSDQLSSNGAGHVIPPVLSNQFIIFSRYPASSHESCNVRNMIITHQKGI